MTRGASQASPTSALVKDLPLTKPGQPVSPLAEPLSVTENDPDTRRAAMDPRPEGGMRAVLLRRPAGWAQHIGCDMLTGDGAPYMS